MLKNSVARSSPEKSSVIEIDKMTLNSKSNNNLIGLDISNVFRDSILNIPENNPIYFPTNNPIEDSHTHTENEEINYPEYKSKSPRDSSSLTYEQLKYSSPSQSGQSQATRSQLLSSTQSNNFAITDATSLQHPPAPLLSSHSIRSSMSIGTLGSIESVPFIPPDTGTPGAKALEANRATLKMSKIKKAVSVVMTNANVRRPTIAILGDALDPKKKKKKKGPIENSNTKGIVIDQLHELYTLTIGMMFGLRYTVTRFREFDNLQETDFYLIDKMKFPPNGNPKADPPTAPHDLVHTFRFKSYAPKIFQKIRDHFSIDTDKYMESVCGNCNYLEFISNSKSGQFFFYSHDGKYMIKTQTNEENKFMKKILRNYFYYVQENPHTLLVRFLGMHRVTMYHLRRKVHFVIMSSVFDTPQPIHSIYDLKGSLIGRQATETERQKGGVLKDLDLIIDNRKLHLGEKRELFLKQIERDAYFLASLNVMDYSLLVGIHDRTKRMNGQRVASFKSPNGIMMIQHSNLPFRQSLEQRLSNDGCSPNSNSNGNRLTNPSGIVSGTPALTQSQSSLLMATSSREKRSTSLPLTDFGKSNNPQYHPYATSTIDAALSGGGLTSIYNCAALTSSGPSSPNYIHNRSQSHSHSHEKLVDPYQDVSLVEKQTTFIKALLPRLSTSDSHGQNSSAHSSSLNSPNCNPTKSHISSTFATAIGDMNGELVTDPTTFPPTSSSPTHASDAGSPTSKSVLRIRSPSAPMPTASPTKQISNNTNNWNASTLIEPPTSFHIEPSTSQGGVLSINGNESNNSNSVQVPKNPSKGSKSINVGTKVLTEITIPHVSYADDIDISESDRGDKLTSPGGDGPTRGSLDGPSVEGGWSDSDSEFYESDSDLGDSEPASRRESSASSAHVYSSSLRYNHNHTPSHNNGGANYIADVGANYTTSATDNTSACITLTEDNETIPKSSMQTQIINENVTTGGSSCHTGTQSVTHALTLPDEVGEQGQGRRLSDDFRGKFYSDVGGITTAMLNDHRQPQEATPDSPNLGDSDTQDKMGTSRRNQWRSTTTTTSSFSNFRSNMISSVFSRGRRRSSTSEPSSRRNIALQRHSEGDIPHDEGKPTTILPPPNGIIDKRRKSANAGRFSISGMFLSSFLSPLKTRNSIRRSRSQPFRNQNQPNGSAAILSPLPEDPTTRYATTTSGTRRHVHERPWTRRADGGINSRITLGVSTASMSSPVNSSLQQQQQQHSHQHRGDEIYFIGIIDILQAYNMSKRMETMIKSFTQDSKKISSVNARYYAERFIEFIRDNSD